MKRIFFSVVLLTFCQLGWAVGSITIDKYYEASCGDYTGSWHGVITDPRGLFGDGGPWEITLQMEESNGLMTGETQSFSYAALKGEFSKRQVLAHCSSGQLRDIFWGATTCCGRVSQKGMLVSKNMMVLELSYENAMTGTNFLLFLERDKKQKTLPKHKLASYDPSKIKSCH